MDEFETEGSSSFNSTRWLLESNIDGPVLATCLTIEFLLSLVFNVFIVTQTLRQRGRKNLKKSSIFLLFTLSLTNLAITILYLPFPIVASAAGEWIFGSTDSTRLIICQINGFIVIYLSIAAVHNLAVISIDRFLSIVKPNIHRKIVSWKTALGILTLLWILDLIVSLLPYYGTGLGEYNWSPRLGGCLAIFPGQRTYVLIQAFHAIIPVSIIVITTIWTFLSTRGFLKKHLKRQQTSLNADGFKIQKQIYSVRVKNLIGIFGTLLVFNFLSWMPYIVVSLIGVAVGLERIPNQVYATGFVLFLFSNVSNPIIQTYFRKDLLNILRHLFCLSPVTENGLPETSFANSLKRRFSSSVILGVHSKTSTDISKTSTIKSESRVNVHSPITTSIDDKNVTQSFGVESKSNISSSPNESVLEKN